MGFFANLKAKRAAKKAQQLHDQQFNEWLQEKTILQNALEIFTNASEGEEPHDQSLVQKDGELVLWTGTAIFREAGRTPARYSGSSQSISIPIVAGIRYRVGSHGGQIIPGIEKQMDKDQGYAKLTTQRLIFAGAIKTTEWSFAKLLSAFSDPTQTEFLLGVSNRQKTSGLRFTKADGPSFARLFAMALHSYEEGIPETIKEINKELKELETKKPVLTIETSTKALES